MTDLPPDPNRIRNDLESSVRSVNQRLKHREELIVAAYSAGIPITEIRQLAANYGRPVDEVITEHQTRQRDAEFAPTADLWESGVVVADRYGLRWRADYHIIGKGWFCRSVGLRVFLTGEKMADRGPLTRIRRDRVFAGEAARAARVAGEADDQAVTVTAGEDPEWVPVQFPVLLLEEMPTGDGRIIDRHAVTAGALPLPVFVDHTEVGRVDTLTRTVGVTRRPDGSTFPDGVAVWSATGAIYGYTQPEVEAMTTKLFPEADLFGIGVSEVDGALRIGSGVLVSVHLGELPAFADACWSLDLPREWA